MGFTLFTLAVLPTLLTVAMFTTRNAMLGFPCVIFWAILGAYAYTLSETPWGDWLYYLAFASLLGMTTFCALGAWGLREKRDTIADEELEKGEAEFIDEDGFGNLEELNAPFSIDPKKVSKRTEELRKRAKDRRSGGKGLPEEE